MNAIAIFFSILVLVGCISRPTQIASTPTKTLVSELIEDGSKEMKLCRFECKKEETQCEIKINTEDSFNSGIAVYYDQFKMSSHDRAKDSAILGCQREFERCFIDICGGKVMVREAK
ncbi:MAG: hypothetical protein WCL34_13045 [Methylococcaceae bacterium]